VIEAKIYGNPKCNWSVPKTCHRDVKSVSYCESSSWFCVKISANTQIFIYEFSGCSVDG